MRILIVNAHSTTPEGQRVFQDLLVCIKEIIKTHHGLLEIKDEYIIRAKDNLQDFLYDEGTSFSQPSAGKQFDSLDFVIISGDQHNLPWNPSNFQVLTLLRMCLRVKKCLFAAGFAMQALVYLSASGLDYPIEIINGNGKGGKIGEMGTLKLRRENIRAHDYFLDNVTGDLYHFQPESNEWGPLCNIGLHYSKTAQEVHTIGKYVIQTPIYRPKKSIHNNGTVDILDENIETKCFLKKIFLTHWLFINCDMEFVVSYRGRWEVHSFSFTNKEKTFEVLAESEGGPLVIEYPRIIGVKFPINKRYKETYQMLKNFIVKYASDIIATGKCQNLSILSYASSTRIQINTYRFQDQTPRMQESGKAIINYRAATSNQKKGQSLSSRVTISPNASNLDSNEPVVFKHSGLASKMKGKYILEHNFIHPGKVHYDSQNASHLKNGMKPITSEALISKYNILPRKLQLQDELSFLQQDPSGVDYSPLKTSFATSRKILKGLKNKKRVSIYDPSSNRMQYYGDDDDASLTKEDVRRQLFPELTDIEVGFEKKIWVPGSMSQGKLASIVSPRAIRVTTGIPSYIKKGPVEKYSSADLDTKTIRSSDPYLSYNDIMKRQKRKDEEKIIGPKIFMTSKKALSINTSQLSPMSTTSPRMFAMTPKHIDF